MRYAIWIGIAVGIIIYGLSLALLTYYSTPHVGHTWDELVVESVGTTIFPLYWGVGQGVVNIVYDIYIFVLPLPVIYRLKLSRKRKAQVFAVFFIAILYVQDSFKRILVMLNLTRGVLGSTVSLVYRVKSIQGPSTDSTYNAGVLVVCT